MTALKVIGIILLVFLLIGFLRVGAIVSFGDELCVKVRVGLVKLTILPKKEKKRKKAKKPKEEKPKDEAEEEKPKKKRQLPKLSFDEILDLAHTALSALGAMLRRTCKRVRVDPLDLTLIFGGPDPARVATTFGMVNSAVFALMPKAEELFYIPDPALRLRVNFEAEGTEAAGAVGLSLRICDLFAILITLAIPMFKWFLRFKKAHRGDKKAHKGAPAEAGNKEETDDTKEKIA